MEKLTLQSVFNIGWQGFIVEREAGFKKIYLNFAKRYNLTTPSTTEA